MAQAKPSNTTKSSGGEDKDGDGREAYCGVARDPSGTASASMSSSSESYKYATTGMCELQDLAAIAQSEHQGWTELEDGASADAAPSSHPHNAIFCEELTENNPDFFIGWPEQLGPLICRGRASRDL